MQLNTDTIRKVATWLHAIERGLSAAVDALETGQQTRES